MKAKDKRQMKVVEFEIDLDETVKVLPTKEQGVVSMLGFDDGGVQYYVKAKDSSNWWKAKQVQKI